MDLTLRGALGWRCAFGEVDPKATLVFAGSIPFTITAAPIARNAALVEAGLDVAVTANMTLGASYTAQLAEDAQDHAFKGVLAIPRVFDESDSGREPALRALLRMSGCGRSADVGSWRESDNRGREATPPMCTLFHARTLPRSEAALFHPTSGVF